ncbi:glycosyltransferase family 4 protein [Vibrio furnissii]|uniref:glycosyltransferase family 4 protein n=1 Tax=Vibrio furnissii TaxID=29494 RepID=UPI001302489D|nr:glycosyltransferase family 4 protein [Vibrio furnissii]
MKRILVVFHDSHRYSGASASMLDLIDSMLLNNNDFTIEVLLPNKNGSIIRELDKRKIKIYYSRYYSCRYLIKSNTSNVLFRYFKSFVKMSVSLVSAYLFSRKNRNFDYIYSNTTDIYFGLFLNAFLKKKHICHMREFGVKDQNANQVIGNGLFYNTLYRKSDAIVVISKALKDFLLSQVNDSQDKIFTVYDDLSLDKNFNDFNHEFKSISILIVGTISIGKGQEFIIDCLGQLKSEGIDINLGIAGNDDNDYAQYLKEKVKRLGLKDNVVFLGFRTDISDLRKQYNTAVVASKSEAFGRVTIEAMNAKQLVLVNDSGANSELVSDGNTGFVFKAEDNESFAQTIRRILSFSESEILDMTNRAYIESESFSSGRAGKTIGNIINELE